MSQENVELMYRAFDAFNRRGLDAFVALMDDDVEALPRQAPMEGGFHGHDGIRRWWKNLLDVFPTSQCRLSKCAILETCLSQPCTLAATAQTATLPWTRRSAT
jgi:ketosteroid isomerase-like protein